MSDFSKMTAWEIACEWYRPEETERALLSTVAQGAGALRPIPRDVSSREFAEWLTEQYRLAMAKGIQIGRGLEWWTAPAEIVIHEAARQPVVEVDTTRETPPTGIGSRRDLATGRKIGGLAPCAPG